MTDKEPKPKAKRPAIKPCPFCGGWEISGRGGAVNSITTPNPTMYWRYECKNCGATGPLVLLRYDATDGDTEMFHPAFNAQSDAAMLAWNARHPGENAMFLVDGRIPPPPSRREHNEAGPGLLP